MAIAVIGLAVLVPTTFILRALAARGDFHPVFISLQAIELVGGVTNLVLLISNLKAGRVADAATMGADRGRP